MILGPAFLRDDFLAAFATSLKTSRAVVKKPDSAEAQVISNFFRADDCAVLKEWSWNLDDDYSPEYVSSTLLGHLDKCDEEENKFTLYI